MYVIYDSDGLLLIMVLVRFSNDIDSTFKGTSRPLRIDTEKPIPMKQRVLMSFELPLVGGSKTSSSLPAANFAHFQVRLGAFFISSFKIFYFSNNDREIFH